MTQHQGHGKFNFPEEGKILKADKSIQRRAVPHLLYQDEVAPDAAARYSRPGTPLVQALQKHYGPPAGRGTDQGYAVVVIE